MATKTIGIKEEIYERLKARKREGESFSDLVDRLLEEATPDWREGFGTLSDAESEELERIVEESRSASGHGLADRQRGVLEELEPDGDAPERDGDEAA